MSKILQSSGAMALATLISRLLGMVREMAYSWFMGDTLAASAFKMAFLIPNTFRRLLGEGALTAAFIPLFKEKEKLEGEEAMWKSANSILSGLLLSTGLVAVLVVIGTSIYLWQAAGSIDPRLLSHESADFVVKTAEGQKAKTHLVLGLLQWMAPYVIFVCLAAVLIAMLNARGHFFIPALSAAILNVIMIASVFLIAPQFGSTVYTQVYGLALGVLLAGVAQAALQFPLLKKEGFRFRWVSPFQNETVRDVVHKMIPGTIGVAAFQINVLVTLSCAYFIPGEDRLVASFDYAVRLMELPQGLFGISLATYLLPTLSGLAAEKKYGEFKSNLTQGMQHLVLINSLAAVFLTVLAEPMIRLLFERGKFGPDATERAASALVFLGPGLLFFSTNNILARAFYALKDIKTPMKISLVCLSLNLVLALLFLFLFPLKQAGLALANSLTAALNTFLLVYAFRRKFKEMDWRPVTHSLMKLVGPLAVAAALTWWCYRFLDQRFGHETLSMQLVQVFVPMGVAGLAYLGLAFWFRVDSLSEILRALRRSK